MLRRSNLDLVINATPSHKHVPVSLEFLNNGFNVLCEKPLARQVSDVASANAERLYHCKEGEILPLWRFSPCAAGGKRYRRERREYFMATQFAQERIKVT
jgi:hypothetical protein